MKKSRVASVELNRRTKDIVFITEPYAFGDGIKLLKNSRYSLFYKQGQEQRAAMRIARSLNAWQVEKYTGKDMCTVAIKLDNKLGYYCSLYLDINLNAIHPLLPKLIDECEANGTPLIVGMDSNAHSQLWGCDEENERGRDLSDLFSIKRLLVLNEGATPTFVTSRAQSIIDVTIANSHATRNLVISDWRVDTGPSFSDHRYVNFELGQRNHEEVETRNFKKGDWTLMRNILAEHEKDRNSRVEESKNLDTCAQLLEDKIALALDEACPQRPLSHRKPNPWWTPDLEQIRTELRDLSNKLPRTREEFNSLMKTYRSQINMAKRQSWRDFCTKAEGTQEVMNVVKSLKPRQATGMSLGIDGTRTLSPGETVNRLMDTHFPESITMDDDGECRANPKVQKVYGPMDESTTAVVEYITVDKVRASFRTFGPHKAAGPDGFKPVVLQNLDERTIQEITNTYQWAIRTGYTPWAWRKMNVIFLRKEGKPDYSNPKAYRPITLSNFLLKSLERIIQWYINENLVTKPLYAQHAYTQGRSTESALSEVVDFIKKSINRGEKVLAVSLDCSGAFDRINFKSAAKAMGQKLIPTAINEWYTSLLESRSVSTDLLGEKVTRIPKRGSPQGGVLSPLIWNLIMDTLLTKFNGTAVKVVGYADDVLIMVAGKDLSTMGTIINRALKLITEWGEDNGLTFNPDKTTAVCFTRYMNTKKLNLPSLRMGGKSLEYDTTMKYLGVTIHKSLAWTKHIQEKTKKALKILNLTTATVGQKWGLTPRRVLWIYNMLVKPVVTYGSIVWSTYLSEGNKNRLKSVQRKAMMLMTASMRSTPTDGMEAVLGLLPLDLQAQQEATKARLRLRHTSVDKWDGIGKKYIGHRRWHDNILTELLRGENSTDVMQTKKAWLTNADDVDPDITIYTDGSKLSHAGAGWAVCKDDHTLFEESVYLGEHATVFQGEVVAIDRALRWVNENCPDSTEVLVRSDSSSAIKAIFNHKCSSHVVDSCREAYNEALHNNNKVRIEWVKGHANVTGNELADCLAKQGAEMTATGERVNLEVGMPRCEAVGRIKSYYRKVWDKRWQENVFCRQTRIFIPHVTDRNVYKMIEFRRKSLNLITQVMTGHALVAYHMGKWTPWLDTTCKLCLEDEESTSHLFFNCPAMAWARLEVGATGRSLEEDILSFFGTPALRELLNERSDSAGRAAAN